MPTLPRALIVEDDPDNLSALSALLSGDGFLVDTAGSLAAARMHLLRALPDVILVDLHLPDGSGLDLLQTLPPLPQGTPPMIVLTGHATVESAIEGLRHGVWDYLIKPVNVPRLRALLARIPRTEALVEEIGALRAHLRRLGRFGPMVGRSATIQSVYDALEREAHTETPVLLWGEAGTGKQMAARALHELSRRRGGPFIHFDCETNAKSPRNVETRGAALPSMLFGRERGLFAGAERRRPGALEQANGGILFVDEITALPLDVQESLLNAIDTRQFTRTGSTEWIPSDARVVISSRMSPRAARANGLLHEEWARSLEAASIAMPPLRERDDDMVLIAEALVDELNCSEQDAGAADKRIAPSFVRECLTYHWPGNVAELQERVTQAYASAGHVLDTLHLSNNDARKGALQGGLIEVQVGTPLADVEDVLIRATLDAVGGTRHRAAALLGISPKTLYNKLQRMREEGVEFGTEE